MATIDQADIRGSNRTVMIRRELPLTDFASPAEPFAYFRRGFSFVLAPAAADPVLELDCAVHLCSVCFFPIWKVFVFAAPFHAISVISAEVRVAGFGDAAFSNIVRQLEAAKQDQLRARHRLTKFLLRSGRRAPLGAKAWTERFWEWIQKIHYAQPAQEATFLDCLNEVQTNSA